MLKNEAFRIIKVRDVKNVFGIDALMAVEMSMENKTGLSGDYMAIKTKDDIMLFKRGVDDQEEVYVGTIVT